jgi:hypothetical protein
MTCDRFIYGAFKAAFGLPTPLLHLKRSIEELQILSLSSCIH